MNRKFENQKIKIYDFDKIWRHVPMSRPKKEFLKYIPFSIFPFIFGNWAIYHNWKNAKIFRPRQKWSFLSSFWKEHIKKNYPLEPSITTKSTCADNECLAVIIHVFYTDVFEEILTRLNKSGYKPIKLYLTTIAALMDDVNEMAVKSSFRYSLLVVENKGRDILPFLKILPDVIRDGCQIILKIHTKKSNHLQRKELWRIDLLNKLIGEGNLQKNIEIIQQNAKIGMIGPSGHILPMWFYYGANASTVEFFSRRMGLETKKLAGLNFVAGSMFLAKLEALIPILNLHLSDNEFAIEEGQKDGTLAHAIERLFSVALLVSNLELADTDCQQEKSLVRINMIHYFSS